MEQEHVLNVKESILAAGVALLREKGIAALTQPQIAKAAAVKQSHLTYYFPTRAALLLAIAEHSIAATIAEVGTRLRAEAGCATIAKVVAEVMIAGVPPRLIIGLIVAADAEAGIRDALGGFIRSLRQRMGEMLAAAGLAADDETVLLFHATIVGLAIMHQARLSTESAGEVKQGVAAILRRLAAAAPGAENT